MRPVFAPFLITLALAGCASQPTQTKLTSGGAAGTPISSQPNASLPNPVAATGDPVVATRQALANARALLAGYSLQMKWTQKGPTANSNGTYAVQGINRQTLVEIVQGDQQGAHILWLGGGSLQVKLAGLFGAVPIPLSVTDPKVVSVRGYTIAQTNFQALIDLADDPGHQAAPLAAATGPAMSLTGGKLLPNTTRLDIYASAQTGLPIRIDFADAKQVVYHMEIGSLKRKALSSLSF